jgi:hypothetical protein
MSPEVGRKVIEIARGLIGSHYINGGYGATPGQEDGCPCRPGGIALIADADHLNPTKVPDAARNLAVFAATMTIKKYCVCAGNYASFPGGRSASPTDPDLLNYLSTLKGRPSSAWDNYYTHFTPRRAYGPGPGGDLGGQLVWGQSCKGIRHFDCVGFISYCYWKATGDVHQRDISLWRTPNAAGTVYDLKAGQSPASLMDGDIVVKADHHIAFVDAQGTVYEAQDTHLGVKSTAGFSLRAPGAWTHLVRMPGGAVAPALAWPLGWWKVWDGNTYYYFFGANGVVKYTKTRPLNYKTPPARANNEGRYTLTPNRLVITWNKVASAPTNCVETFYNATAGCEQMNANSNLYSPLVATRLI